MEQLLQNAKTIAVVGLSGKPWRTSYQVSQYMQSAGYRIMPVNPKETEVLGEKCYRTLEEIPEPVDIVNIFRRSEEVAPVVDSAIAIHAKAVWMQMGIEDEKAAEKARAAGLQVIMDRCIMRDHQVFASRR